MRDNIYKLIAQLKHVEEAKGVSSDDKTQRLASGSVR